MPTRHLLIGGGLQSHGSHPFHGGGPGLCLALLDLGHRHGHLEGRDCSWRREVLRCGARRYCHGDISGGLNFAGSIHRRRLFGALCRLRRHRVWRAGANGAAVALNIILRLVVVFICDRNIVKGYARVHLSGSQHASPALFKKRTIFNRLGVGCGFRDRLRSRLHHALCQQRLKLPNTQAGHDPNKTAFYSNSCIKRERHTRCLSHHIRT